MFAVFATVLCLMSVSHAAPLACKDLVRPMDQLDHFSGRWALVAGSLNDSASAEVLKQRNSVTIQIHNSTYTQSSRYRDQCQYDSNNFSVEGNAFTSKMKTLNFTGTLFHTSCPDCLVLRLDLDSPKYDTVDFYLFSRTKEVEQKVMEEFRAQVECLNMPPPVLMDPTQELCPEQTGSEPVANTEEKTEGQEA